MFPASAQVRIWGTCWTNETPRPPSEPHVVQSWFVFDPHKEKSGDHDVTGAEGVTEVQDQRVVGAGGRRCQQGAPPGHK